MILTPKTAKVDGFLSGSSGGGASLGAAGTKVDIIIPATPAAKTYSWEGLLQAVQTAPAGISTTQIIIGLLVAAAIGYAIWLLNKK